MVWGLVLKPKRRYSQRVRAPYEITGAALDITHADDQPVQVMLKFNNTNFLLCTLQRNLVQQAPLKINIKRGRAIEYFIVGKSPVHLVGNFLQEEDKKEETYYIEKIPISFHKSLRQHKRYSIRDPLQESQQTHQPKDSKKGFYTSNDGDEDEDEDEFIKKHKVELDKMIKLLTN